MTSFHVQVSGSWFLRIISYDIDMACIIMYCQDPLSVVLQEVKGLTNKLYAYALARKKTALHAKFQVHRCYG